MELEITPTTFTYGGDVMGRLPDGRAVFIPFGLPGERLRVRLVEEKRGHARAALLEVLEPSPERIAARCPHFGTCGGCHYQHLAYEHQLEIKTTILREQLERLAGIKNPPLRPAVPSPSQWNYRNSVQFHLTPEGKLGYQRAGSRQTDAILECHLPEETINQIWPLLDMETLPGMERIALRVGAGEDILLSLESSTPETPEFSVEMPLSAVFLGPGGPVVLAGDDYLIIEVLERPFHVSAGSFFQVNTAQAANMVRHVLDLLPLDASSTLLDVYCGVGLFSTFFAPRVQQVIGIELSSSACEDFAINLDEFENVSLYQGKAEEILPHLETKADAVIVDPPRSGLEPAALDALLTMQPSHLVYISCDPATLARDTRRLLAGGYQLEQTTLFDVFPQTFHIESISLFRKAAE